MSQITQAPPRVKAWLLARSGALAGTRFPLGDQPLRIGRAPDNDVALDGSEWATVSLQHAEIARDGDGFAVRDLGSTNGTWVNGERVSGAVLPPAGVLQLGAQGPEFELVLEEWAAAAFDRTLELAAPPLPVVPLPHHESVLRSAVDRARRLRAHGAGGDTMHLMRNVVEQALRHGRQRTRRVGWSLAAALIAVAGVGGWRIAVLGGEKHAIDGRIAALETQLQSAREGADTSRLMAELNVYQSQGEDLQRSLLYRFSGAADEDYVTRQLHALMGEFGAEVYRIPPEFVERVNYYIGQDQGPNRPNLARVLVQSAAEVRVIRRILQEQHLPPDLAYIPVVESALSSGPPSSAGAAGPWQFTVTTARALGLRVDGQVDERKELTASTRAACKYLRDLILDFGAGSSVMLALAAYNSGTARVKNAVMKTVQDPIQQRNFWYLYRTRALPLETREYVPKVFAAMLIGRDPRHFGF